MLRDIKVAPRRKTSAPCYGSDPCAIPSSQKPADPWKFFADVNPACLDTVRAAHKRHAPIIGVSCPMTPVELILATGGLAVDISSDSAQTMRATEHHLPHTTCSPMKSTCGCHLLESDPLLELTDVIIGEACCDSRKALFRLMNRTRFVYMLKPPDRAPAEKKNSPKERWRCEVRKLAVMLEKRLDQTLTNDQLWDAIRQMNRQRKLHRELAALMESPAPPMTGLQLLQIRNRVTAMDGYIDALTRLLEHLQAKRGKTSLNSRTRVLLTGVPMNRQAMRVVEAIEDNGGLVVCFETCNGHHQHEHDVATDGADPLQAIADRYYNWHCVDSPDTAERRRTLSKLIDRYQVDAIIEMGWHSCPRFAEFAEIDGHWIPKTFDLPFLHVQTDFAPRDTTEISQRIGAFLQ